jgi:hypothetical protein
VTIRRHTPPCRTTRHHYLWIHADVRADATIVHLQGAEAEPPARGKPCLRGGGEAIHLKTVGNRGVFLYFVAVFAAIGLLFAITALPGNSVEVFPEPSPQELVQAVRWAWEGALEGPPMSRALDER